MWLGELGCRFLLGYVNTVFSKPNKVHALLRVFDTIVSMKCRQQYMEPAWRWHQHFKTDSHRSSGRLSIFTAGCWTIPHLWPRGKVWNCTLLGCAVTQRWLLNAVNTLPEFTSNWLAMTRMCRVTRLWTARQWCCRG